MRGVSEQGGNDRRDELLIFEQMVECSRNLQALIRDRAQELVNHDVASPTEIERILGAE